jgi:hypothetical protein
LNFKKYITKLTSQSTKLRKFPERKLPFADLIHPHDLEAEKKPADRTNVSEMAFAGGNDFLVVAYQKHDEVRFFWPQDDTIVRTNSVLVSEPKGCCVAPDGRVFVVSGKSVIRVNPESGEARSVVKDPELVAPTRVAYDRVNDDLLVVEHAVGPLPSAGGNPETLDNVRRYRAADGKKVAVYGRVAGRTYGLFNPLDWGGLLDIVTDGEGGFFTVEEFPRRVAHFRGHERHELVAQWFGGMQWGALCTLDPADPAIVYHFPDHKHCARGRIDYTTRAWTLTHLYDLPDGFSWFVGKERHAAMFPSFGGQSYWEVRHVAGATFLVNNGRLQGGCGAVVRVDEQENRLLPVAFLGGLHPSHLDRNNPPEWWLEAMKRAGHDPKTTGYKHFGFSWSDTNRDGRIETEELRLGSGGNTYAEAHCFVDSQWNVYYALRHRRSKSENQNKSAASNASDRSAWMVIPNEGRADLPVWDWNHARRTTAAYPEAEMALGATSPFGIFHDRQGNTYTVCNGEVDHTGPDLPPSTWPNNTTRASRIHKWAPDGRLEWSVGLHTAAKDRPPGQFAQVRGVLGEVNDCLVILDACEPASVWTHDGLFAGSLYGARADDGLPDLAYTRIFGDDNHWGLVLETKPITGHESPNVLWGGMSDNNTLIYRVGGWENWERQNGKLVNRTPTLAARWKGTGLRGEYFANTNLSGAPALSRCDADIWFGPMWGDHREVPARKSWFSQRGKVGSQKSEARGQRSELDQSLLTSAATGYGVATDHGVLSAGNCSARWTGFFEPPLGERFTFVVYTYGAQVPARSGTGEKVPAGSRVRLWVAGQLIIDQWENVNLQKVDGWVQTRACPSKPIALTAGQLVPIRLEYAAAGGDEAHLHLFLESNCIDLRHVPQQLLYPERSR